MTYKVEGKAIGITDKDVLHNHVPVTSIRDMFPEDAFGGENEDHAGALIHVTFDGVGSFSTDIASSKNILRIRGGDVVGKFYKLHGAKDGTRLFFEKTGPRAFRISVIN